MKPAKFDYFSPTNIKETLNYLAKYGEDAKVLAGGQSLIPIMNMRLATPKYLIDLGRVKELSGIDKENNKIIIGATTSQSKVEQSVLIKEYCPILIEAVRWIGHSQIRNRGTVGGSIAHADPSAELPCVITALRGEIVIESSEGEETVTPEEFFLTYMLTSLQPDQIIKELRFPVLSPTSGYAFEEVARRHGDFALVEVAVVTDLDEKGKINSVQLAVGGVGPVPCKLEEVEELLIGQEPTEELLKKASEKCKDSLEPEGDIHGSSEYRLHLAGVLLQRALKKSIDRAKGGVKWMKSRSL